MLPKTMVTTLTAVPEVVGDLVVLAVVAGALAEPRREDGLDGQVELLVAGRSGTRARSTSRTMRLERLDHLAQRGGVEIRVLLHAARRLGLVERVLELLAVDVHDDAPEHLDEAPVGVPAEALVAGQRDEAVRASAR